MDGWGGDDDVGDVDDHDHDEDERCLWTDAVSEATGGRRANTQHFHHCLLFLSLCDICFMSLQTLLLKSLCIFCV